MLKGCLLFDSGGNYSEEEVDWYRQQMNEIDKLFDEMVSKRTDQRTELAE